MVVQDEVPLGCTHVRNRVMRVRTSPIVHSCWNDIADACCDIADACCVIEGLPARAGAAAHCPRLEQAVLQAQQGVAILACGFPRDQSGD